ncbi:phosphotransferase [Haloferula sp. A504]|uniref:phosphotransferase n=1 Tax=Haloferula sp. A504 TaxID=3373601 RepID=UPI0031C8B0CD|nr:ecdysteroid 22-kinase family protein [Verrucomicrobiaceae bacterium E54]
MAIEEETRIAKATGATRCRELDVVQRLWSGYGAIRRYGLEGSDRESLIVKHISPPTAADHPRGWNTDRSHRRKLRSYQVESVWYSDYAGLCDDRCRVPECLAMERQDEEILLLLEDLDAAGFPGRRTTVDSGEVRACLAWLAQFHATFLGNPGEGLWECGTYWHLETRPDELEELRAGDPALWRAAGAIDARLKQSAFQTLVHGDAKLANFCFSQDGTSVAAVDFQYVGRGCGMKDVAYFIGSCFRDEACEAQVPALLDFYFAQLRAALVARGSDNDAGAVEAEWRELFPIAWTDFHRFLKGWSPGHWKLHSYSERLARQVLAEIGE